MRAFSCPTGTMATVPDWKLQLLARRRQEEAAVRGREQAEKDRLAQMPAWKRGLLERRRAKLGVPVGEPGPGNEATDAAPPEPDEPVVLLEAIGPVHQNRFIRQERQELKQQQQQQQQGAEEQLIDRRPPEGRGHISGRVEAQEQRPGTAEAQEQSLVGRESREQRLSQGESVDRKLGVAEVREQSLRPAEALEWRLSPRETEERSSGLSESRKWKKSPREARERNANSVEPQEQTSGGSEMGECRLSSGDHGEHGEQRLGVTEIHKWRMNSREVYEQSPELLGALEWRLNPGEESKGRSGELGPEQRLMQRKSKENSGLLETQRCRLSPGEFRERSPGVTEAAEMRLNPGDDVEKSSRPMELWKWRLNSGKAREWSPGRSEAQEQKTDSGDQKLPLPGLRAEEGRTGAAVEEAGDGGRMVSSLRSHYSVTSPPPPEEVGTRGSGPQEEEAAEPQPPPPPSVSPLPPAPPTPQAPGDPLMSRLFYGVKPGPGVGAPRRSGHTFTVNPRRSGPPAAPAAPAPPEPQVPGPGKKRYPTAEEILVLGGYLRLSRSCLAKGSPERHHKQLKISFNESALETTYQYPSESSVLEELGPEPEAPSTPGPSPSLPDEEEDEEELLLLQKELRGGLQTKALIVDESCRR
ncbi:phostensin isoform X1 [Phascolarctos cinereus]|uniref:Phostensin isoform X1 n=3 Tax=Phascolarctos cinereus TaxID=38626 RepID=A0A6P5J6T8_PHACI|nr:phostensin isoform X1 [Phascolarctos cinereus]